MINYARKIFLKFNQRKRCDCLFEMYFMLHIINIFILSFILNIIHINLIIKNLDFECNNLTKVFLKSFSDIFTIDPPQLD